MERTILLSVGPGGVAADLAEPAIPRLLTKEDIRRHFVARVPGPARGGGLHLLRGDHDLNPGMAPAAALRAAAVLVPLVDRSRDLSVLLTQRTANLEHHAGQIAFPGGRVEETDADDIATALRETEEEIGLSRNHVEPVGRLDRYITRTGFTVTPVVGLVEPPFKLTLAPDEVADAFEVPLSFILDPANRQRDSYEFQGVERHFYVFRFGERNIWGATAGMLVNLAETLTGR
ncbi:MAG TPA: CoA pyrophosphatase [Alphaproteobacteria bacterium]|nr:CoA pyrophosphatase [Alphaproteobacteria bacterium]